MLPLKDKNLRFLSRSHKYYYLEKGKKTPLTSVTTWLSKFHPAFNAREKARELAKKPENKKEGKGVRYWINKWRESTEHGTKVHEEIELHLLDSERNPLTELKALQAKIILEDLKSRFELDKAQLHPEVRICYPEKGLAGTVDLIIQFDDKLMIYDWKTNGSLAHSMSKYQDQLNTYAYILEKRYGYQVIAARIAHLQEEGHKVYPVPKSSRQIERYLSV